jgi:hypothetical protein
VGPASILPELDPVLVDAAKAKPERIGVVSARPPDSNGLLLLTVSDGTSRRTRPHP